MFFSYYRDAVEHCRKRGYKLIKEGGDGMSWKDKLFGSRLLPSVDADIRRLKAPRSPSPRTSATTVKDGSSTIHMYGLDDVESYCPHSTRIDG